MTTDETRLLSAASAGDEEESIRPQTLDEYVGQDALKENLRIFIQAALQRNESLDHVLLYGPPGLGKTTLSYILAHEMHSNIRVASGPSIEKAGDLAAILSVLEPGDILFIDEIHRLSKVVEEVLYPAMEDFCIDVIVGKEAGSRSVRLDLPPFTLVGATTRAGDLSSPLRDRFGIISKLEYYTNDQLASIVRRTSRVLGVTIEEPAVYEIARRSRGTPRLANRLLKRVRDFAEVKAGGFINDAVAAEALSFFEVDELGLDVMDNKILSLLTQTFSGRPVGLGTIASALGEDPGTIEDVYEPFLLQRGLIDRTAKGRVATKRAFDHLGLEYPTA